MKAKLRVKYLDSCIQLYYLCQNWIGEKKTLWRGIRKKEILDYNKSLETYLKLFDEFYYKAKFVWMMTSIGNETLKIDSIILELFW